MFEECDPFRPQLDFTERSKIQVTAGVMVLPQEK